MLIPHEIFNFSSPKSIALILYVSYKKCSLCHNLLHHIFVLTNNVLTNVYFLVKLISHNQKCILSYIHFFVYKEHLYKDLEAEKGSKNKEFLRN